MDLILRLSESLPPTAAFPLQMAAATVLTVPSTPFALLRAEGGQLVSSEQQLSTSSQPVGMSRRKGEWQLAAVALASWQTGVAWPDEVRSSEKRLLSGEIGGTLLKEEARDGSPPVVALVPVEQ